MTIYRIAFRNEIDGHHGYEFVTSRRVALKKVAQWRQQQDSPENAHTGTIERLSIVPSKRGICHALNQYAAHAENG